MADFRMWVRTGTPIISFLIKLSVKAFVIGCEKISIYLYNPSTAFWLIVSFLSLCYIFYGTVKKVPPTLIIFKEKKYNSYFFGEQMKFPKVVLCALAVGDKCLSTCIRYFILAIWRCWGPAEATEACPLTSDRYYTITIQCCFSRILYDTWMNTSSDSIAG